VVALLRQNGWSERGTYREGRSEEAAAMEAARDAFLYLLAFITLEIWATQDLFSPPAITSPDK
jgi:hypothetical protein